MPLKPLLLSLIICLHMSLSAQSPVNYDETAIEPYSLPDVLMLANGDKAENVADWEKTRRPEILALFKGEVYGHMPAGKIKPSSVKVLEQSETALDGLAIRKQIALVYQKNGHTLTINMLMYLPKEITAPPIFIGYNFYGNHTTIDDEKVILTQSWLRNNAEFGITDNRANDASRGKRNYRWPIKQIIANGFGLATIYCGDVDPDRNDFSDGVHPFFYKNGQTKPLENEWGTIGGWAWGYSQVLDYLMQDELSQASKFILFGHSRLGKTSLWAGALDERFDLVISNNSGCGGAALFKRKFGERTLQINERFPHWFNGRFKHYSEHEELLPLDQHMLIALMAPRPVYIASAEDDQWADPKGEYLSGFHASPVYALYGKTGLLHEEMPALSQPVHHAIGYHIRPGKHDVTNYDWEQYMIFAKKHLED